jgi:branched-chain amino acid transport system permease protein
MTEAAPPLGAARPARLGRAAALALAAIVILLLPLVFADSYWRGILIVCALNVLLALGLDFILGYAGQLNLGQSAFYAIGAYTTTLLTTRAGLPFWPAFLCGVAAAGAAAAGY